MGYVLIMDTEERKLNQLPFDLDVPNQKVIAGLNGVTTRVDYILVSDENIERATIQGKKYPNMTEDEKHSENIESVFNNKILALN